ncbi:hypothetical protein [Luteimonas sp. FCS-9]|uniref:hypothetical protein n=1 Tax=Luteimonas sp. FCS-9 TaxID=1547516 RepID=UPI00063E8895|nr:hypothetical protein [Luteimonas sp. FCS-9]KLI97870.1 hypothetical protein WQ56_16390 [Luteimonas sp. FCS-9]
MTTQTGKPKDDTEPQNGKTTQTPPRDPKTGLDREVGDLDDPDAPDNDDALPGRAGGGLAGG